MKKQSLVDLIRDLEWELLRLGYTKGSMTFYRSQWKALLLFAQKRKQIFYAEQLGLVSLKNIYISLKII